MAGRGMAVVGPYAPGWRTPRGICSPGESAGVRVQRLGQQRDPTRRGGVGWGVLAPNPGGGGGGGGCSCEGRAVRGQRPLAAAWTGPRARIALGSPTSLPASVRRCVAVCCRRPPAPAPPLTAFGLSLPHAASRCRTGQYFGVRQPRALCAVQRLGGRRERGRRGGPAAGLVRLPGFPGRPQQGAGAVA